MNNERRPQKGKEEKVDRIIEDVVLPLIEYAHSNQGDSNAIREVSLRFGIRLDWEKPEDE